MANYEGGSVELKISSTADQAAQAMNRLMAAVRGVRGEIASFDKAFDNVSKSVNRLANGMKVIEKLNFNKVNVQIAGLSDSLGRMSAHLAKVDMSGFDAKSDQAAQSLNRLTNSFRQLEKLKNIDTRQAYRDLDRLGRISSAGMEKLAGAMQGVDLSQIQGAGTAINNLVNGLMKIQNLKLDTNITGNLKSQLDALAPTLNEFINKLSGISADGLKDIAKAFRDLPKGMERLQALDLSRLGTVFDTLATQITPFLAKLKEASAELQAFATISKNLSGTSLKIPGVPTGGVGKLDILSSVFTGTKAAVSGFASGIGRIATGLKNLATQADKTRGSFLGMLNVGKLYFLINYTKRMTQSFAQMLKSAIDFIEVENLFSRAMGSARDEAYRFANSMSEAFGLALPDLMKAQGIFNNILKALGGINEEMAQILSQSLTKMAVDFSALYNVSVESALEKLEAALVGQTKPIRSVSGMDITMATLQTYLTQLGIVDRTVRQLSEIEKRLLRIYALQEQLRVSRAIGSWAQELEQPANQLKILGDQTKELTRWISTLFVQSISKALPYINAFVMVLKELVKTLSFALGYKLPVTENIPDLLDTDGATEGLEDVEDALKDIKNASMGIDELNIIAPVEATGAPEMIDPRLLAALQDYDNLMDGVRMKANDIRDAIMAWLGFTKQINELGEISWVFTGAPTIDWAEIQESARTIATRIAEYLNDFIAKINWYAIGANLANGLNTALHFIYAFMTTFDFGAVGSALANGLNGAIDTIDWDLLGRTLATKWTALVDFFYDFVTTFGWKKFGDSIATSINSFFAEIDWAKAGKTLSIGFLGVLDLLNTAIENIDWKKIGESIKTFLNNIDWKNIGKAILDLIGNILGGIYDVIAKIIGEPVLIAIIGLVAAIGLIIGVIKAVVTGLAIYNTVMAASAAVTSLFKISLAAISIKILAIIGIIAALIAIIVLIVKHWDEIKESALKAWDAIKSAWDDVANWFSQKVLKPIQKVFSNAWDGVIGIWTKAVSWFDKNVVEPIASVFIPLTSKINEIFSKIWEIITVLFKVLAKWFNDNVIQPIINYFKPIAKTIGDFFQTAWSNIKNVFKDTISFFSNIFSNALTAIKNVFTPILNFFQDLWNKIVSIFKNIGAAIGDAISGAFRGVINSALSMVENLVNTVIRGINGAVSVINKIPGVTISRITELKLPRFEQGGFPDKGAFVYNEGSHAELLGNINGRTAVVNNEQIISAVSQGVAQAVASVLSAQTQRPPQPIQVTSILQVAARELARATNQANVDMGTNQLSGVFELA